MQAMVDMDLRGKGRFLVFFAEDDTERAILTEFADKLIGRNLKFELGHDAGKGENETYLLIEQNL